MRGRVKGEGGREERRKGGSEKVGREEGSDLLVDLGSNQSE